MHATYDDSACLAATCLTQPMVNRMGVSTAAPVSKELSGLS